MNNPQNNSDKDTIDLVFKLLTEEIRDQHEFGKLEGWTPWVVGGSLVMIASTILQKIWEAPVRLSAIETTFLLASLVLFVGWDVLTSVAHFSNPTSKARHFLLLGDRAKPMNVLFKVMFLALLAFLSFRQHLALDASYVILISGVFAFISATGVILLVIVFFRIPLHISDQNKTGRVLVSILLGYILINAIIEISRSSSLVNLTLSEAQIGGLASIAAFMILWISKGHSSKDQIKYALIDLRQQLVLDSLSPAEAVYQTRVALRGMFMSDIVTEDIRELKVLINDVRAIYTEAFIKIEILKETIKNELSEESLPTGVTKLAIASTLDSLHSCPSKISKISRKYFTKLAWMKARLKLVSNMDKAANKDRVALISEIENVQSHADSDLEKFIEEYKALEGKWNKWFPQEPRSSELFEKKDQKLSILIEALEQWVK